MPFFDCNRTDHHHIPCHNDAQVDIIELNVFPRKSDENRLVCVDCVERALRHMGDTSQPLSEAFYAITRGCAHLANAWSESAAAIQMHGMMGSVLEKGCISSLCSLAQTVFLSTPEISLDTHLYAAALQFFVQFVDLLQRTDTDARDDNNHNNMDRYEIGASLYSSSHAVTPGCLSEISRTHKPRHIEILVDSLFAALHAAPRARREEEEWRPDRVAYSNNTGRSTQDCSGGSENCSAARHREWKGTSSFSTRLLFLSDSLSHSNSSATQFLTHHVIAKGLHCLLADMLAETTGRRATVVRSPTSTQHTQTDPEPFCLGSSQQPTAAVPTKPFRETVQTSASSPSASSPQADAHSCELLLFILCQLLHFSLQCVCGVCLEQWAAALSADHYDGYTFTRSMTSALEQFYRDDGTVSNALMLLNTLHGSTLLHAAMLSPFQTGSLALQEDSHQKQYQHHHHHHYLPHCIEAHTNLIKSLTPLFLHTGTSDVVIWTTQVLIHELRLLQSLNRTASIRSERARKRDGLAPAKVKTLGTDFYGGGTTHDDASFSSHLSSQCDFIASYTMDGAAAASYEYGVQANSSVHDWVADYAIEALRVHPSDAVTLCLAQLLNALAHGFSESRRCGNTEKINVHPEWGQHLGGTQSSLSAVKVLLALATHDAVAFNSLLSGQYLHYCLSDAFEAFPDEIVESIVCVRAHLSFSQLLQLLWATLFWKRSAIWLTEKRSAVMQDHGWKPSPLSPGSIAALTHAIVIAAPRVKRTVEDGSGSSSSPAPPPPPTSTGRWIGTTFAIYELSPLQLYALACVTIYLLDNASSAVQGLAEEVIQAVCTEMCASPVATDSQKNADEVLLLSGECFSHSEACLKRVGKLAVVDLILWKTARRIQQLQSTSRGGTVINDSAHSTDDHQRVPSNLVDVFFSLTDDRNAVSEPGAAWKAFHLSSREHFVSQLLRLGGSEEENSCWCRDSLLCATSAQDFVLSVISTAPHRAGCLLYSLALFECPIPHVCAEAVAALVAKLIAGAPCDQSDEIGIHAMHPGRQDGNAAVGVVEYEEECGATRFVSAARATAAGFLWFNDTFARCVERKEQDALCHSQACRDVIPVKSLIQFFKSTNRGGGAVRAVEQMVNISQVRDGVFLRWLVDSDRSASLQSLFCAILCVSFICPLDAMNAMTMTMDMHVNMSVWVDTLAECVCSRLAEGRERGRDANAILFNSCLQAAFEIFSDMTEHSGVEPCLPRMMCYVRRCAAIHPAQTAARLLDAHLGSFALQQLARFQSTRKAKCSTVGITAEMMRIALAADGPQQQQHTQNDHTLWKWAFLHADSHVLCLQVLYLLLHRGRGKELARSHAGAIALLLARLRAQDASQPCSPHTTQTSLVKWILEMSMRRWGDVVTALRPTSALCRCAAAVKTATVAAAAAAHQRSPCHVAGIQESSLKEEERAWTQVKVALISAALCFFDVATDAKQSTGLPLLDLMQISADLIAEDVALDINTRFFSVAVRNFPQLSEEPASVSVFLSTRPVDAATTTRSSGAIRAPDSHNIAYTIFRSRVLVSLLESSPVWLKRSGAISTASALLRQWVSPSVIAAEISTRYFVHPVSAKEELLRLLTACESYFYLDSTSGTQENSETVATTHTEAVAWDALRLAYHAAKHLLSSSSSSAASVRFIDDGFVNPMDPSDSPSICCTGEADEHTVSPLLFPRSLLAVM